MSLRAWAVGAVVIVIVSGSVLLGYRLAHLPISEFAVTYEVGSGGVGGIQRIDYVDTPNGMLTSVPGPAGDSAGPSYWREDVVVNAGKQARIVVHPAPGALPTCRIIVDADKTTRQLLAEQHAAIPGQPVACVAVLPTDRYA